MTTPVHSTTLYFREGSSDKVYQAQILPEADGFVVEFQYGRRGNALTSGRKTPSPVSLEAATKVFEKLVREKQAKGYTPGECGTAYAGTENAGRVSGHLPQLLNAIDHAEAERLILDPAWCMQEKYDGVRMMLRIKDGAVDGINRKGLTVALPQPVADEALKLAKANGFIDSVFDGELIGDVLHVFDVLRHGGADTTFLPLSTRLDIIANELPIMRGAVQYVGTLTLSQKSPAFAEAKWKGAEGVVFKRLDAPYTAGRPASGGTALKFKFTASATFRVREVNTGKRSVQMEMLDGAGQWIGVGSVTIPPNHAVPDVGTLCEATYLYAHRDGALFQPVYKGERGDQDEGDCTLAQLQFKGEARAA